MIRVLCACGLALALAACSGPEARPHRVTGTVTWKGVPIENGRINLIAADGKSAPASAKIEQGRFELYATPGVKRVEVLSQKEKGFDKAMNQQIVVNDIPREYNGESKLRFEVQPHDGNVLELVLPQR
jgi:hypothetical protein